MRIPRIYQAVPLKSGTSISLDAQAATHVARVLRLKQHDHIIVFNGQGGEYTGVIDSVDKRSVTINLQSFHQPQIESPLHISLLQGVSRSERMDYTIQKSVELGVSEIYPVTTQHMSVHLDEARARKKRAHWQGVVNSACEQSGRNVVPSVHELTSLQSCVDMVSTGQLKHKKYNLSREVSDQFGQLGKRTYDLIKSKKKDIVNDADVSELLLRVKELETAINDVDDKLEKLRSKELAGDDPAPEADGQSSESTDSTPQTVPLGDGSPPLSHWQPEETQRNDYIDGQQHGALQPVRLSIQRN